MNVRHEIILVLRKALKEFTSESIEFLIEKPESEAHGDYSSNIALVASKILNKNPLELANELVEKLDSLRPTLSNIDKVEAVKPGFINFWLSEKYLISLMTRIIREKDERGRLGGLGRLRGKRIMVEFTDPNPFKEFHIGHLYSNAVGESISRLLEGLGADVKRANYQGDVGMHVAKAIYGLLQNSKFKILASRSPRFGTPRVDAGEAGRSGQNSKLKGKSLKEKIKILGEAYAFGAKVYEGDEKAKKEIEKLNKKIYAKDEAILDIYEKGRQWSLEYFETIYKRLGTKFDYYYFESEVGNEGLKLVKEYLKKGPPASANSLRSLRRKHLRAGVFEESQGAVIFPGEKHGLHNRVFINSLGLPTYEAKELGLAFKKYADFKFDHSISVTGNEIIGYFKVILAALKQINPELASKTKHLSHGMVRLPTGKMSSRFGNILTGEWLLDEAKKLLKSKFSEMEEDTLEKVAVGSVKYALLKSSLGHDIEFNFEESINIQGNSGPYLQYTFARTQSVIEKFKIKNLKFEFKFKIEDLKLETEEIILLRNLSRFSEIMQNAAEKFAPNLLCNYLFNLAQKFNLFYQKHKIIGSEQENFRLTLTAGAGQVLKTGLKLLGISAPEKM